MLTKTRPAGTEKRDRQNGENEMSENNKCINCGAYFLATDANLVCSACRIWVKVPAHTQTHTHTCNWDDVKSLDFDGCNGCAGCNAQWAALGAGKGESPAARIR
jgi:hypothetical protein